MIRAVVWIALGVMAVGLAGGALFTLVAVLLGRDAAGAVALVMTLYDSLAVLMPAALWAVLYARRDDPGFRPAYMSMGRAMVTALQGAALGSLLGGGPVFLAAAAAIARWRSGLNVDAFESALWARVVWSGLLFVAAVTIGSALPLGMWAYYTGPGRED